MKTKIVFFFFITIAAFAQRPKMHLIIAADVEDNAYTVRNFSKEEKIKNMFNLVCRELEFDLQIKYLHTFDFGFSSKGVLDSLSKIKILTRDDIVIFYYLGRGFYPTQNTKVPHLEFQDTKKMLSFDQIRKKLTPLKARLSLIVADCDESFSLLNPSSLPHSLIKTSQLNASSEVLENEIYAALKSEFSLVQTSFEKFEKYTVQEDTSEDSIYLQKCIFELDEMLNNREKLNIDLDGLRHISLLKEVILEYLGMAYPRSFDTERKRNTELLLGLEDKIYRTRNISMYNYRYIVDSLFLKRKVLDFNDSQNKRIRWLFVYENKPFVPPHWILEDQEKVIYYLETLGQLNQELNERDTEKPLKVKDIHTYAIVARLENYKKTWFPFENVHYSEYRKNLFKNLPKITKANFKTIDFKVDDYQVVIDSMFIKRSILLKQDPLSVLLDSLIQFENRPLIRPIEFLNQAEVDKYYDELDKLEVLISTPVNTFEDSVKKVRLGHFFTRIGSYIHEGFPRKNSPMSVVPSTSQLEDIITIIDHLFDKNMLFDFNNLLHFKLDSIIDKSLTIHTLKLEKLEWAYYTELKKSMEMSYKDFDSRSITSQILKISLHRINEYPISGFPKNDRNRKQEIDNIPFQRYNYIPGQTNVIDSRNKFYQVIIDSLYLSKQVLNFSNSLYKLLSEYIEKNIPVGTPVFNTIKAMEPSQRPVIMQLFLSECGIIEVANGHSLTLKKNQFINDYTSFVTFNFNDIVERFFLNNIGDLSLANVFSSLESPYIHYFKRTAPINCSLISTNANFVLPNFKKLPTEGQVNDLFVEYVKTNSISRKKAIKSEITSYFEKKALLKVKSVKPMGNTAVSPVNIPIKDYFEKLDNSTPKVDSVGVRQGSVKRNKNFSKITSMMVVEN